MCSVGNTYVCIFHSGKSIHSLFIDQITSTMRCGPNLQRKRVNKLLNSTQDNLQTQNTNQVKRVHINSHRQHLTRVYGMRVRDSHRAYICFVLFFLLLGPSPRPSYMLGRYSATALHMQPWHQFLMSVSKDPL